MTTKRTDYISWEKYFMEVAELSAQRSKDPSTQVGCCIVNEDNKIIAMGYNGLPNGCSDDDYPWDRDTEDKENSKYTYVCHAELNAICNSTSSLKGATMYVSLFPCNECAKLIIQTGIKNIVYKSDKYCGVWFDKAAKRMFESAKVSHKKYE
jgi:dCMP deaminase